VLLLFFEYSRVVNVSFVVINFCDGIFYFVLCRFVVLIDITVSKSSVPAGRYVASGHRQRPIGNKKNNTKLNKSTPHTHLDKQTKDRPIILIASQQ